MSKRWLVLFLLTAVAFCTGGWAAQRQRQAAWNELKQELTQEILQFDGQTGVVIEDLRTGWRIEHQPTRSFPAASVIKVPMMTACYQAAQEGRLDLNSWVGVRPSDKVLGSGVLKQMGGKTEVPVTQLIDWMITESDNTATNVLMSRLGMDYFNRHFQHLGLQDTKLERRMMDFSKRKRGVENVTTAGDMAELFRKLYRSEAMSPAISRTCLELLKRQRHHDRIPAQLPRGIPVAHKTGLERSVCHDAGIIFTRKGDLLICVLTQRRQKGTSRPAKRFIARLAQRAYRYIEEAS